MGKTFKDSGQGSLPWYEDPAYGYQPASDRRPGDSANQPYNTVVKYVKCSHSHPPLSIEVDGVGYQIWGGSCWEHAPGLGRFDVEIGFDSGMAPCATSFPWSAERTECVFFPIKDHGVPYNPTEFKNMVDWTAEQLKAGKRVHAGCIGGHGRTGMFFAALVAKMTGRADAITYVREAYCPKAVESDEQVRFLNKYFGCTKVPGTKDKNGWPRDAKGKKSGGGAGSSGGPTKPAVGQMTAADWQDYMKQLDRKLKGLDGTVSGRTSSKDSNSEQVNKPSDVQPVKTTGNIWYSVDKRG